MKKTIFLTLFICGLLTGSLMAATYRVNNKLTDNPSAKIYSTIQAAHDAANDGDTIMVEGSPDEYSDAFECAKRLIIKGPGYFLDENPGISANKLSSRVPVVDFNEGSEGSVLIGVSLGTVSIYYGGDNITFRRCFLESFFYNYSCENIAFSECYFTIDNQSIVTTASYYTITNLVMMNCIINGSIYIPTGTGVFLNNVFNNSTISIPTGFDMKNNILFTADKTDVTLPNLPDPDICNNISIADHFGTANHNLANVDENSLFLQLLSGSTDGKWQLKTGSPAIGAGEGGIDCGAFGGAGPYILSGVPTGPVIYQLNVSSHSTSGNKLPVTIKVKSY